VVVGTTTVRALESLPPTLPAGPWRDESSLLIQPGHAFRFVDALMTNFHLPRSTLLALVGAFVGLDRLKALYALAQREGYRFYSYGDCMLIV
jgi:S-adenosylmethionine:tRNA ribosyltransferase-isomerase